MPRFAARLLPAVALVVTATLPSAAPAARPQTERAETNADDPDRQVCKKFARTGSLVASTRVCHTKREWDRLRDDLRSFGSANSCTKVAEGGSCDGG